MIRPISIGILYICTGRYRMFWEGFHASAEEHFIPAAEKHYYVWSNARFPDAGRMHGIYKPYEGYPWDTLKRFHLFSDAAHMLQHHDYLFFFNANTVVRQQVLAHEVCPEWGSASLCAALASHHYKRATATSPHCSPRPEALPVDPSLWEYIQDGANHDYIMGGFHGGKADAFLEMAVLLAEKIDQSLAAGRMPVWHDETMLNKYSTLVPFRKLSPSFLWPSGYGMEDIPCKIEVLHKALYGGPRFRTQSSPPSTRGLADRLNRRKN